MNNVCCVVMPSIPEASLHLSICVRASAGVTPEERQQVFIFYSNFVLVCYPSPAVLALSFFCREGFRGPLYTSTGKSNFVYPRHRFWESDEMKKSEIV